MSWGWNVHGSWQDHVHWQASMFKLSVMLPDSLCHSKHKVTFRAEAESTGHLYLHKHDRQKEPCI